MRLPRLARFPALILCLCLSLVLLRAAAPHEASLSAQGGFRPSQANLLPAPMAKAMPPVPVWDSFQGSDANTGSVVIGPFVCEDVIEFYAAGYAVDPTRLITLVRTDTKEELPLRLRGICGPHWTRARWSLPDDWHGREVTLEARDSNTGPGGWVALSRPLPPSSRYLESASLAFAQLCAWLLLIAPGLAVTALLGELPWHRRVLATLCTCGLAGYLIFFVTFADRYAGAILSSMVLGGSLMALALRRRQVVEMARDKEYSLSLGISLAASLFAGLGCYLYGGQEMPEGLVQNRAGLGYPGDPWLPWALCEIVAKNLPLQPFCADWLSSDRPPLQAGLALLIRPMMNGPLHYTFVGVAVQSWVWPALWVFLRRLGASPKASALVLAVCLFNGFFFFNTFYCWPKLLPTAYLLLATALLWERPKGEGITWGSAVLAGLCAGLAMLGHGGSAFGLAGIVLSYFIMRRRLNLALVVAPALLVVVLMVPWTIYQKVYDPPGDRLIKYHLAGREAIDPRGSLTVIAEAYRQTPVSTLVENRLSNFQYQLCGRTEWYENTLKSWERVRRGEYFHGLALFGRTSREAGFFHYAQALGPMLFALPWLLVLLIRHRKSAEAGVARGALWLWSTSTVVWCLLMFSYNTAVMHAGSYFTGATLFAAVGLALHVCPRVLRYSLLGINTVFFVLVWIIAEPYEPIWGPPFSCLYTSVVPSFIPLFALSGLALLPLLVLLSRTSSHEEAPAATLN